MSMVSKLHGRELSFNNLLDLESGRRLVEDFELPAAAIVKHNNPCGAAVGTDLGDAVRQGALATDPPSAFGGVFCFNRIVDRALAEKLHAMFVELVFAGLRGRGARDPDAEAERARAREPGAPPGDDQRARLQARARRAARAGPRHRARAARGHERRDRAQADEQEWGELLFAMRVCKHVRSNAIVLARNLGTVGIGAGQMSRVDSVRIAIDKARAAELRSRAR